MIIKRKYSFVITTILILILLSSTILANANEAMIDIDVGEYGFVTIEESDLPEGVTPIEIKTEEQFSKVIEAIKVNEAMIEEHNIVTKSTEDDFSIMSTNENVSSSKGLSLIVYNPSTGEEVWALSKLNVWANFDVFKIDIPKQTIINKENSSGVGLSGYTLGLSISDGEAFTNIASNKLSAFVRGDATLNYYLLIDGLIRLYSTPVNHSFTYDPN